eukprot:Skav229746  [mRNA]  locus=scaffold1287:489257:493660:+ [translate_table: standard]
MVEEPSSSLVATGASSFGLEHGPQQAHLKPVLVDKDGLEVLELPYPVATVTHTQQRAYLTKDGQAEWQWARVHDKCGIEKQPGRLLRDNRESILQHFSDLQIPKSQFLYRGAIQEGPQDQTLWNEHTVGSRGFFGILLWLLKNRTLKNMCKVKAFGLMLDMALMAFNFAAQQAPLIMMGMVIAQDGHLYCQQLAFNQAGLTNDWAKLLDLCPGALSLWGKLGRKMWMNKCISSAPGNATFQDVWLFLAYLFCNQKLKMHGQNLWLCFGAQCLPELVVKTGDWLSFVAQDLANQALQMLPSLRTKAGFIRKMADPANKVLLLRKLQREKVHRMRVARSHGELGGSTNRMLTFEEYMDCLLHMKVLEQELGGCKQLSVSWDPSTYGGKDTFVGIAYSPFKHKAGYLCSQQLTQVMISELDISFLDLARQKKLSRVEGFREIRGLSAALRSIGSSLVDFEVPAGLLCRPLKADEIRLKGNDGKYYIVSTSTAETVPEVPPTINLADLPCLVSISDQGPNNQAALNFLAYSKGALLMWPQFDPFHRTWNDLKLAFKRSACKAWKHVLQLTLVANLNFGPFGSSAWFYKKRARLQEYVDTRNINSESFQKYCHLIAQERRMPEPRSSEEAQLLFDSLMGMNNCLNKGPLIKLMRWFSWFESMQFYKGDMWALKMVLEDSLQHDGEDSAEEVTHPEVAEHKDDHKQLQELKKRKGSWKLAPTLISSHSLAVRDIILSVGKSSWELFAARAREVLSPLHVLEMNISCAHTKFWAMELVEILKTSLHDERHLTHLYPKFIGHPQALEWHIDLLNHLVETRTMSLASFHCMPPGLYYHILFPGLEIAMSAHKLALKHFHYLLEAEGAMNAGADIQPLAFMHWRHNPLIRCILMAFEQDEDKKAFCTDGSAARKLMKVLGQTLGDSRVIENVHQHGRDLFRASKAKSFSNTKIFATALKSGALEERKVPCVKASSVDKAVGKQWKSQWKMAVVSSLKSSTHSMPKSIQDLMAPKNKDNNWPSPAPASLFQSVSATTWFFHYWEKLKGQVSVNASWLSTLARPGATLAQRSSGILLRVMAAGDFGFMGHLMQVGTLKGAPIYELLPARESVGWHYVLALEDWLEVPVQPLLRGEDKGPVVWAQAGEPLPLHWAALVNGHRITFDRMKALLKLMGASMPPGQASKKKLHEHLIQVILPEHLQGIARTHVVVKEKVVEEDMDSDFSEVLSELGQEDGNKQDLKEYKEKKKNRRLKQAAAKDLPVETKKRGRAKGKAKAKAKPKAKAKGLVASLLNRSKALAKKLGKQEGEAAPDARMPEAPAASSGSHPPPQDAVPPPAPAPATPSALVASPGPGERPSKAPRREAQKSPEEILGLLAPPGCRLGISFQDHRFTSRYPVESSSLKGKFAQKTMTVSFALRKPWKDALREVHKFNWEKWQVCKHLYPLPLGQVEQAPGDVSSEVFEMLEPTIKGLGDAVRY